MKIVQASYEIIDDISMYAEDELKKIERCARVSYDSLDKIDPDQAASAKRLIAHCLDRHHDSVIEHCCLTVKFICDRGVSHELVRHRLASYTQESTRYCNYSKDKYDQQITVIKPCFLDENSFAYAEWESACKYAENMYIEMIRSGCNPEEARTVLPTSLKTTVVVTANYREWRHILDLRTAPEAHPQMRELMLPLLKELYERFPVIFDDIYQKRFETTDKIERTLEHGDQDTLMPAT